MSSNCDNICIQFNTFDLLLFLNTQKNVYNSTTIQVTCLNGCISFRTNNDSGSNVLSLTDMTTPFFFSSIFSIDSFLRAINSCENDKLYILCKKNRSVEIHLYKDNFLEKIAENLTIDNVSNIQTKSEDLKKSIMDHIVGYKFYPINEDDGHCSDTGFIKYINGSLHNAAC